MRITGLRTVDVRFPTSDSLDGSDAMNPDPDYSAAYVVLETDGDHEGHGLTFTIGRGNEICIAAIEALRPLVTGLELDWIAADMGRLWRHITGDSQLRWIGPDKGAIHLATGAVVNAAWDLWAKAEGKPVWQLVADMTPEELVRCIDFRYLTDCITPEWALEHLRALDAGKADRIATLKAEGYPCYTTSAGWLGYGDDKLRRLCREAVDAGFKHVKLKVGRDLDDDIRRLTIARDAVGPDVNLMIDANQVWDVDEAIDWTRKLAFAKPWFIEEPTSPDDIAGHRRIREAVAPVQVATGEMCQNRIMFKQFIMEGAIDVVQIDSCRLGGLNEVLAVMLMAAKHDLKVCPHAGGVGLCEYVQHMSMIDYLCIAGTREGRVIEFVDHLHEHFEDPCVIRDAAYMPPEKPGFSIQMKPESLETYRFRGDIGMTGIQWKQVGKTGVMITDVSFGTASIGNLYREVDDAGAAEVLNAAWARGLRYFDTAPHYGRGLAEQRLGRFLKGRDGAVISTKVGRVLSPAAEPIAEADGYVNPAQNDVRYDYSGDGIEESFEQSCERLGRTRVDILYVHDIGRFTHGDGNAAHMEAFFGSGYDRLVRLKEAGRIGAFGLGVNECEVCLEVMAHGPLDVILLAGRLTLLDRSAEAELVPLCRAAGTSLVLGGVFNSGILATGPVDGATYGYGPAPQDVLDHVTRLQSRAEAAGLELPTAALHFAARHPATTSVLLGTAKASTLNRNLDALLQDLPKGTETALD